MLRRLGWCCLPFLTGGLYLASFPPLSLYRLAWVAVVPLAVHALEERRRWRRWVFGYVAGFATMVVAFWWTRHVYPLGPWALAFYFGLYFPLFGLFLRLMVKSASFPVALAVPVAWVTCDFLRATLFTGLPFYLAGHSQIPWLSICQIADLGGVSAVSFLVLAVNGAVTAWILRARESGWKRAHRARPIAVSAAVVAGLVIVAQGYGLWRLRATEMREGPTIGLIQPNIRQNVKEMARRNAMGQSWDWIEKVHQETTALTDSMMRAHAPPDLVIWPESGWLIPIIIDEKNTEIINKQPISKLERAPKFLLVGCERLDAIPGDDLSKSDAYVSAVLVRPGPDPLLGWYDKVHLVPFGEYLPLNDMKLVRDFYQRASKMARAPRFTPGDAPRLLEIEGHLFGPVICFEVAFPGITREEVNRGATFIVNLSNEGWFEDSAELPLMFDICRFRAIETRRAVVRATNTGISGFILPTGAVDAVLTPHEAGTRVHRVRTTDSTTVYARCGEAFPVGCLILVGLAAGIATARRFHASRN